jgi:hypothetical protein
MIDQPFRSPWVRTFSLPVAQPVQRMTPRGAARADGHLPGRCRRADRRAALIRGYAYRRAAPEIRESHHARRGGTTRHDTPHNRCRSPSLARSRSRPMRPGEVSWPGGQRHSVLEGLLVPMLPIVIMRPEVRPSVQAQVRAPSSLPFSDISENRPRSSPLPRITPWSDPENGSGSVSCRNRPKLSPRYFVRSGFVRGNFRSIDDRAARRIYQVSL